MSDDDDKKHQVADTDSSGEEAFDGETSDLESDDDTLKNAQDMGLYPNADDEHPAELNIAEQVEKAEKEQ